MGWWERRRAIKDIQGRSHTGGHTEASPASPFVTPPPSGGRAFGTTTYASSFSEERAREGRNPTALLSAASLIDPRNWSALPGTQPWQTEGWDFHDTLPELHTGTRWISNALSRVRLYVGIPDPDGTGNPDPVDPEDNEQTGADPRAREPLEELFDGPSGQSQMMARLGAHFTIPGESVICGWNDPDSPSGRGWHVASREEIQVTPQGVQLNLDGTGRPEHSISITAATARDQQSGMALRLWRPHHRYSYLADSPVRSLLPTCRTLRGAHDHVAASLKSRLAGAGVLFIPNSARVPGATASPDGKPLHVEPDMAAFMDSITAPLINPSSAAAVVPLLVRMADDAIGKVQYMRFSSPLDDRILDIREADQRRLAMGLDMPMEELLGKADLNHWSSWQISEEAVKMFIAPLCEVICAALTDRYLRPRLRALGIENVERYVIAFDVSQLTQRPNRTPEAQNLHDRILISDDALRREANFGDDDAPDPEEAGQRLMREMALKGINFEIAHPWLRALNVDVPDINDIITAIPAARTAPADPDPAPEAASDSSSEQTPAQPGPPNTPGSPDNPTAPGPRATTPGPALAADGHLMTGVAELVPYVDTFTVAGTNGHPRH